MAASSNTGSSSSSSSPSSSSPCAACKFLRRKCAPECIFAPYFPPDQPLKFANVHKIFGASNVSKLLNDLSPQQREDAVRSLAYEAEARVNDPVYGCVGTISLLQMQISQLQQELRISQADLARASIIQQAPPHTHLMELNAPSQMIHPQQQPWIPPHDHPQYDPYQFPGDPEQ